MYNCIRRLCKVIDYVYGIDISIVANSSNKTNQEILDAILETIQYYDTQIVNAGLTIKMGNSNKLNLTKEISSEIKNNTTVKILMTFNGIFTDLGENAYYGDEDVDEVKCQVNNEVIANYLHSKFDGKFEDIQLRVSCAKEDDGQYLYKSKFEDDDWSNWESYSSYGINDCAHPRFWVNSSKSITIAFLNSKTKLAIENTIKQDISLPKQYIIYIPKGTTIVNVKAVYRIIPEYITLTDGNIKMKSTKKEYINEIIESGLINQINDSINITPKNDSYPQTTKYNVDLVNELSTLQMKYNSTYSDIRFEPFDLSFSGGLQKCSCILNNV
jgi:hypothetical protein